MAAHTAVGYLLAVGLAGARGGRQLGPALLGLALWVICLNGGTLALNSAFDRDEGDVAYLRQPPPPPRRLAAFSLGLMVPGSARRADRFHWGTPSPTPPASSCRCSTRSRPFG